MKITQVSEQEVLETKNSSETVEETIESKSNTITFNLSKKKGKAEFRFPNVMDLIAAELEVGIGSNGSFSPDFYRHIASRCCLKWGDSSSMPDESKIRLADDDQMVIAFANHFGEASVEANDIDSYCRTIEESEFDLYEITVNDNTKLVCREPSQKDNKSRESARTTIEGTLAMIARLCESFNGQKLGIGEIRVKLNLMSLAEYLKLSRSLTYFRS